MNTPLRHYGLLALLTAAALSTGTTAQAQSAPARDARTAWFHEARFGLFIHWGVYAVPAGEWKGRYYTQGGEWLLRMASIPVADYKALGPQFTADAYDPKAWAALAREAGTKYVVVTAKHHDGLALYDSAASDWNVVKATAAGRDLIAPLAAAVRAEGLKFGAYYSQSQDWINPGGENYGQDKRWDPAQLGDYDTYLKNVAVPQVREILTRYQPDIIWWDTPVAMTPERVKPFADALTELAPGIISNNRLGQGFKGDTKTPEQHIPPRGYPGELFEVCMTMNGTWGYKTKDTNWKSTRQLLQNLSDITSKGGNFLLNVGPDASGRIPPASVERLQVIGRWMQTNGEAIYATGAGPFPRRLPWGRVTQKRPAPGGPTTLYLHVWDWPADGKLLLPTLAETPAKAALIATRAAVSAQSSAAGLVVSLPASAPDENISVVRLDFPGPVTITQLGYNLPGPDGRIEHSVIDADLHDGAEGNFTVVGAEADAVLTNWKEHRWSIDYPVRVPSAGRWRVTAEIAAEFPAQLTLNVKQKPVVAAPVPATGGFTTWQTVELGVLEFPAKETTLVIKALKDGWRGGPHLRRLWLAPAQ